jgi:hypothetical protein
MNKPTKTAQELEILIKERTKERAGPWRDGMTVSISPDSNSWRSNFSIRKQIDDAEYRDIASAIAAELRDEFDLSSRGSP